MKLVLIRHAQSVRNAIFRGNHFYHKGQPKLGLPNHVLGLTTQGETQAKDRATSLYATITAEKDMPVVILHSGFERTMKTASLIKKELIQLFCEDDVTFTVPLEQNHLLRERDAGYAFEMDEGEAGFNFPFLQDYWKFEGTWFAVPPGGESFVQVMDRVSLFLHTLTQNHAYQDKTIYAVTHGGTMRAFKLVIEKIPFQKADELVASVKNCGVLTYQYTSGSWQPA